MTTVIKRCTLIFTLALLLMLVIAPAALAEDIRVLLYSGTINVLEIYIEDGDYELLDDRGRHVTDVRDGSAVEIESNRNGYDVYVKGKLVADGLLEFSLEADDDDCLFEYDGKLYRGSLRVVENGAYTYIINTLDVECYLYGVVGREIGYNQPLEAVKAQAVASRSFAIAQLNPGNNYYDIGSGTSSQAYGGYTAEVEAGSSNVVRAVDYTEGEIICYKRNPFEGFYHSNAGGHTEDLANVWGGTTIPLKGVESPYDQYVETIGYSSSIYQWQQHYTSSELRDLAERYAGKSIGEYRGIEISTQTEQGIASASGRVMQVTIKGSEGEITANRDDVRNLLGNLKSNLFTIDAPANTQASISNVNDVYVLDRGQTSPVLVEDVYELYVRDGRNLLTKIADWAGAIEFKGARQTASYGNSDAGNENNTIATSASSGDITIYGKGYGHGVGMSQWGAIGMAADGYNYNEIIEHYFNMDFNSSFTIEFYDDI